MSSELIAAIKDRIVRGYEREAIAVEVMAVGYSREQFEAAYTEAEAERQRGELISYGELLSETWSLMKQEVGVVLRATLLGVGVFVFVSTIIFILASVVGIGRESSFILTAAVVPLIGLLISFVTSLSVMRAVVLRDRGELFRVHVGYVVRNFTPLMLVTVYLTIITQVGYALFFVPGIIATAYLLFATPIAVAGEGSGFKALTASIALVHGRFLATLGRFLVVNLIVGATGLLVFLAGGGLIAVLLSTTDTIGYAAFPFIFVAMLAFAIGAFYATTCGLVSLFESLKCTAAAAVPIKTEGIEAAFKITVGVVVAILAVIAFVAGFAGYTLLEW